MLLLSRGVTHVSCSGSSKISARKFISSQYSTVRVMGLFQSSDASPGAAEAWKSRIITGTDEALKVISSRGSSTLQLHHCRIDTVFLRDILKNQGYSCVHIQIAGEAKSVAVLGIAPETKVCFSTKFTDQLHDHYNDGNYRQN